MIRWAILVVTGFCTLLGLYMVILSLRNDKSSVFLFAAFGIIMAGIFLGSMVRTDSKKGMSLKRMDNRISAPPHQTTFLPHRFVVLAIIITGIATVLF